MTCFYHSLRDQIRRPPDGKHLRDFDESIETGFQIATFQGPLCAEPVIGMAFILQELTIEESDNDLRVYYLLNTLGKQLTFHQRTLE